jgi:sulfatase maturation enzyme AslB (radical SAM superfamily)
MFNNLKLGYHRLSGLLKDRGDYLYLKRLINNNSSQLERFVWSLQPNFSCTYNCSYCIQSFGIQGGRHSLPKIKEEVDPNIFLKLNKLEGIFSSKIKQLLIQGGEPLLYKSLPYLIEKLTPFRKIIIISNLSLDLEPYIDLKKKLKDKELKFIASYHYEFSDIDDFSNKVVRLNNAEMLERCCFVDINWNRSISLMDKFLEMGIKSEPYKFIGKRDNKIYPVKAQAACLYQDRTEVQCLSTMVLIAPDGNIYNCHAKMYRGSGAICSIEEFPEKFKVGYLYCGQYGHCQPCQVNNIEIKPFKKVK